MQQEIEAKFLHQDIELVRAKLKEVGATLVHEMADVKRVNLDFADYSLDKKRGWLRVRQNGDGNTAITYKQKVGKDVDINGVTEIETIVGSYEQAVQIFSAIGMIEKSVQHTKRELWKLEDCEIMIDQWPWVDPYIEIEAETEESVKRVAKTLGYNWEDAVFGDVGPVYFEEYDLTEDELYIELKYFDFEMPIPDWLAKKRKNS